MPHFNGIILYIDHEPITALFGKKETILQLAASRLPRWATVLASYDYEIKYKIRCSFSFTFAKYQL